MRTEEIKTQFDVIDSRDVIDRIENLESLETLSVDESEELANLKNLEKQCEGFSEWEYGATLIREDYFVDYITDLIEDCYDIKQFQSKDWPYRHFRIDYESAADEALCDYSEVNFDGQTYLIWSC